MRCVFYRDPLGGICLRNFQKEEEVDIRRFRLHMQTVFVLERTPLATPTGLI